MSDNISSLTTQPAAKPQARTLFVNVLKFVVRRWVHHPRLLVVTISGVAMATITDVLTPLLAGRLVTDASQAARAQTQGSFGPAHLDALWMLAGMTALGLVGTLGRRISFIGITRLTTRTMREVAEGAFSRVQRFSSDWHANNFAGSTVRRLTRGMWAVDTLGDTLILMLLPEAIVLCGTTIVLGLRWPIMGFIQGAMTIAFIALSVRLTLNYVAPSARVSNRWDTRVGAALADAITCNAVVKAFGAERREEARLGRVLTRWTSRTERSWIRGTNSGNFQSLFSLFMRSVLIGGALYLWERGEAGPGDVAYVLTMVFLVHGYLRDIGQQVSTVQRSVNEMEELVDIFEQAPGVIDRPGSGPITITTGAIEFRQVWFRYVGQSRNLYEGLDLVIPSASRVALVGPSGSGKTTLTKLLQRLYDVQGGQIVIDGVDIATVTQESLRSQIAIVPQEPVLFHRSLAENIAYGRAGASAAQIEEAARLANASDFIERLPQRYETLVGERGVKLSGGERQRIAIARAFLADARILILDEATSSLDSESEALVQEAMQRLMVGRTVIVIAHRLSTVVALDRILVFSGGVLREDGPHATLIERPDGIYRRLFELQSLDG